MNKTKIILISIGICLLPLIVGIPFFLTADGGMGVSGADAFKVAFQHMGYVIPVILGILASVAVFYKAITDDWYEDYRGKFAIFAIWCMLTIPILAKPVNIKTDPIGSAITTEQIQYLREKGFDQKLKK